ncbi:parvulin-like peptidyl-prolyl isomerase [secondary endosymbiont of Heteropsylla cubana]|uniref:Chaperone SurA n=1 Tax=secondary endosymbiont of Heteropsylla cubana TaxID=134287 RepID=J3YSY1_9ENTR|nr:peptidylprolyl isomerase SurA [secondary endosymbiont of Heteropsylla cubana]AFP85448.1 parvulin-like peptidyl-prolyl isomerase [secondary endosymbiont of Heteropsylla cubana]
MKKWKTFIFSLIFFTNDLIAAPQLIDRIAAVVETDVILVSEINKILFQMEKVDKKTNQYLKETSDLYHKILNKLILEKIFLQLAKREHITISDEDVDQVIENIASQHHISVSQLYDQFSYYHSIDKDAYRAIIRKEILIDVIRKASVKHRIKIVPEEVDTVVQQTISHSNNRKIFNLSHIIIPLEKKPTQEQLEKAKEIAAFIIKNSQKNENLFNVSNSDIKKFKLIQGNQAGWKKIEEIPLLFKLEVERYPKGKIIGPIRSIIGYHLLKINDIYNNNQKLVTKENHLRHILLRNSVLRTNEEAQMILLNIREQINNGTLSFSTAAKKTSEDLGTAYKGGDLGWIPIDSLGPIFRDTLTSLKEGEISTPIHSPSGWHLIQFTKSKKTDYTNTILKEDAYHILFNQKFNQEEKKWIQEKLTSTYVKIFNTYD